MPARRRPGATRSRRRDRRPPDAPGQRLTPDELARFEARAALALGATLHLGRTLRRAVDLCVPAVAGWARVDARNQAAEAGARRGEARVMPLGGGPALHVSDVVDEAALDALVRVLAVAVRNAVTHDERRSLADTLRSAFLPPSLPSLPGLGLAARYRAAEEATSLGGDFYDVHRVDGGWALTVGDVCGKGVPAALMTAQLRQALRTAALVCPDPADALALTDRVMRESDGTRFATVLHGRVHAVDGSFRVQLAGGGHPDPLLLRASGEVLPVAVGGTLVGMLANPRFAQVSVDLGPGDALVLFTDGIPEARAGSRMLGEEALASVVGDSVGLTAQSLAERVEQTALEHVDGGPHDDLVVLVLRPDLVPVGVGGATPGPAATP